MTEVDQERWSRHSRWIGYAVVGLSLTATTVTAGLRSGSFAQAMAALLIALAPWSAGLFLGFLFGIPKTTRTDPAARADGSSPATPQWRYDANSSLQDVSDWLTKAIVGISLTKLDTIRPWVWSMAGRVSYVFSDGTETGLAMAQAVAAVVLIFFFLLGLLAGYLWIRLYLTTLFANSDYEANRSPTQDVDTILDVDLRKDSKGSFTPEAMSAARAILTFQPKQLRSAREKRALARANIVDGKRDTANDVLIASIESTANGGEKLRSLKDLLYNSLYIEPDGYKTAIQYGETYLGSDDGAPSADIYAYLACAYGQKHAKETSDSEKKTARDKAVEYIAHALRMDREKWEPMLRASLLPGGYDNDLASLADDPEVKKLLPAPGTATTPE